jgi:hypothetical protein
MARNADPRIQLLRDGLDEASIVGRGAGRPLTDRWVCVVSA